MILYNLKIVGQTGIRHIHISNGKIKAITDNKKCFENIPGEDHIDVENALCFPGIINSHDHLDFNLFSQLGNKIYKNYTEWGKDIHEKNKEIINEVLKVPESLRIQWGICKNLLNGVTTVVNHGKKIQVKNDLITILQPHSLHSVAFEKKWKWKLNGLFAGRTIVIHLGEGTDADAEKEIDEVIKWNFLKRKVIAAHGVAMSEEQAQHFKALIWCPASNYFLLGKTAPIHELRKKIKIVFGTDSTLTASWNIWEHFRLAKEKNEISDEELIKTFSANAAEAWNLSAKGKIQEGFDADIVIARSGKENFFEIEPQDILSVIHGGRINLVDAVLKDKFSEEIEDAIEIAGRKKFVRGNLSVLVNEIRRFYPAAPIPFESQ